MKEEFVNYNQALTLKELGFDEPCLSVFYSSLVDTDEDTIKFILEYTESQYYAQKGYVNGILRPLKQQVFRWFREKHDLWFRPDYYDEMREYDYQGSIHQLGRHSSLITLGNCKTVEELEAKCIDELIELVKNK